MPDSLASFLNEITTFSHPEPSTYSKPTVNEQFHKIDNQNNNLNANLDFNTTLNARLNDLCLTTSSTNFTESNNEKSMTQQLEDKLIEYESNSDNEQTLSEDDEQIISDNEQYDELANDEVKIDFFFKS